jgi:hypothetical protein
MKRASRSNAKKRYVDDKVVFNASLITVCSLTVVSQAGRFFKEEKESV